MSRSSRSGERYRAERRALRGRALFAPWIAGLLGAGCGGSSVAPASPVPVLSAAPPVAVAPAPPLSRPDGRLPETALPQRYQLALAIDPAQPRFSGVATIQIDVPRPTWHVVMHARGLTIARAVARAGSVEIPATVTSRVSAGGVVPDEIVLTFASPLAAGAASLTIAYDAPFSGDLAGLYRVQEGGRWYAYTQFEATDARRAFPCFDEPSFKTPYDVTITAPRGVLAFGNAPEGSTADAPDGKVVHTFQASAPLPSYLVAFAVGDFDVAEGRKEPFPIRVVTTKGKAHLTSLALDAAAALVDKLGEYFDLRYPYAKLDLVAVPDFAAGAMENPGLITFRDVLLLLDPAEATRALRRSQAEVIAHELAHQWFGDLVTMRWWDDIWLNEGFATWAEAKMVDAWKPSFGATLEQIASVQGVMDTDALSSARAVREPVRSTGEAAEAFDGITYDKGAAVLRMIEAWLGPEIFRRGVQQYLHANAWGNASAADLFKSLDYVSTQKVDALASGFLDHSGVPQVFATVKCGTKDGAAVLDLHESEWRPLGAGGPPPRVWSLPVCVSSDALKAPACFTLGAEPIARKLGAQCPTWLYPNEGQAGYYRFILDKAQLFSLARAQHALPPADRLGLLANAWADVRQGALDPSTLLDVLPLFDGENDRFVVGTLIGVLRGIDDALVEDGTRPAFRKYVLARLGAKKRALGWRGDVHTGPMAGATTTRATGPSEAEADDRVLERRDVLWAMGETAGDRETLNEANGFAIEWLTDPRRVPEDAAAIAVPLASIEAGRARLEELRAAARNAPWPEDRVIAIRAMGYFDDPEVLRAALDLSLTDEIKLSELRYLFGSAAGRRGSRSTFYAWEKENWSKLRARMPGSFGVNMLTGVAGSMCLQADLDDATAFFTRATAGAEGVKRRLDEALESSRLCVALRQRSGADVTRRFLGK